MTANLKNAKSWAGFFLILMGLWVLAGATFKLLWGTPNDLPQVVRNLPLSIGLTYKLVIGIELCVVALCFFKRRLAWPVAIGMFLVFDAILIGQIVTGEAKCGCFGSKISMSPWVMLGIDSFLLIGLLTARPWRLDGKGIPLPFLGLICAAGLATPWLMDRQIEAPHKPEVTDPGVEAAPEEGGDSEVVPEGPGWVALEVEDWEGMHIGETQLAQWLDLDMLIQDGKWVLYRITCDHCAEHLENMAGNDDGMTPITLVRVREARDEEETPMVHIKPQGPHVMEVELPATVEWVVTTPIEMHLEAGQIVRVVEDE